MAGPPAALDPEAELQSLLFNPDSTLMSDARNLFALMAVVPVPIVQRALEVLLQLSDVELRRALLQGLGRALPAEVHAELSRSPVLAAAAPAERSAVLDRTVELNAPVLDPTGDRVRDLARQLPPQTQQDLVSRLLDAIGGRQLQHVSSRAMPPADEDRQAEPEGRGGAEVLLASEGPASSARTERVVNTGFAEGADPDSTIGRDTTLAAGTGYLFWLEIGEALEASIETTPTAIDAAIPEGADLVVALFGFGGEIEVAEGSDVGELRLQDGTAMVTRQPGAKEPDPSSTERRMRFPVRTPAVEGSFRLRCHLYYRQILIQSRVVTAQVTKQPRHVQGRPALSSEVDFTLAPSLYPSHLKDLAPHRLSILLNQSPDGTHEFRIMGADGNLELKTEASFEPNELQGGIGDIRGALRLAAWGNEQEWSGQAFRYDQPRSTADLLVDLIHLARRGYRFYDQIAGRLAGAKSQETLKTLMAPTGYVQIAIKKFASYVVPAAGIYDSLLQTKVRDDGEYSLCDTFEAALDRPEPLDQVACFRGDCPHREDKLVICPSGFWGYRHALGLPVTVGSAPDGPAIIEYDAGPGFAVGVSTDPDLHGWPAHEADLRAILPGLSWDEGVDRQTTLDLLKQTKAQLVYFYCHGGVDGRVPFIQVGPKDELPISREDLRTEQIEWAKPRPLVFVNGCHTTALSPETAIDLVSGFVETAHAAGVIGTEITISESLAGRFGREFFHRFVAGTSVGEAVRGARLALLKERNPMGLVYIPFVTASLRLVKSDG